MVIKGIRQFEEFIEAQFSLRREATLWGALFAFPPETGSGTFESIISEKGWAVWIADCSIRKPLQFEYQQDDSGYVGFAYREGNIEQGLGAVSYPHDAVIKGDIFSGMTMRAAGVYYFPDFLKEQMSGYFDYILAIQAYDDSALMKRLDPSLKQMLGCRLTGFSRRLFMESRVLDMAANLADVAEHERAEHKLRLSAYDRMQLRRVTEILEQSLTNPPGIAQLSQMTALNEFKLKAGFKREFGMTIFEYLRRLRMEKAIRLLEEADAAIPEVADRVGYRTLHGFSQTFSRYYGISPALWRRRNSG